MPTTATHLAATAYRVRRQRDSRGPAFLAPPDAFDQVEVVDLDTAETVLLWDLPPRVAGRLVRLVRTDLHRHGPREFLERWSAVGEDELRRLR